MGGLGRREVSRGTAGEQSERDDAVLSLRVTAGCARERERLGRNLVDS